VRNTSDSDARFQKANAVTGHGQLGARRILQRENYFTCEPRIDFENPIHIDEGRAVNAEESCRIEAAFQLGDGLVDRVAAAVRDSIGEFVLGYKMSYRIEIEK
jgi:hypothetical protein